MILSLKVKQKYSRLFCLHFKVQDLLATVNQPTSAFLQCGNCSQLPLKILLLIGKQLELITPASKMFEEEELMLYEVTPIINETILNLNDVI